MAKKTKARTATEPAPEIETAPPPEGEPGDETAILVRMQDAVEVGALKELLEAEGIPVATPGLTHRSLLGMAGAYVEIVVRVPSKDIARAKELLDAFRTEQPPEAPESPADRPRTDRLVRVAVFAACVLTFGSAHFYARRRVPGAILLGLEVVAIGLSMFGAPLFLYAIPGIVLADALGAARLVRGDQRGTPAPLGEVVGPALAALAFGLVPMSLGIAPRLVAGEAAVRACEMADACGAEETLAMCIDRAATRTFGGHGTRDGDRDCADCLEETTCMRADDDCAICDGRVRLVPTVDTSAGPLGTGPGDLQMPIPSLFERTDDGVDHAADLDALMRALEAMPPPPTTTVPGPTDPARP
jgi:hypothetical protein